MKEKLGAEPSFVSLSPFSAVRRAGEHSRSRVIQGTEGCQVEGGGGRVKKAKGLGSTNHQLHNRSQGRKAQQGEYSL